MSEAAAPWRRQTSQPSSPDGGPPAPPPPPPPPMGAGPPPPPPLGGSLPSVRIKSEIEGRGRSPKPTAPGEPPAAIQNAMMTKDKKPFTYTPGGLDLSQIRSPRIQRRINRNMADEGVGSMPAPAPQQEHAPVPMPGVGPTQVLPPPPPPQPARFSPSFALGGPQAGVSAQAVQQTAASLRPTTIAKREQPDSVYIAPVAPPPMASPSIASPSPLTSPASPQVYQPQSPQVYSPPPQAVYSPPVYSPPARQPMRTPPVASPPTSQLGSLYIPPVADFTDAPSPSPPPPPQRNPQSPHVMNNTPWNRGSRIIPIQMEQPQSPEEAHLSQWQREQQMRQQMRQQQPLQHQQQLQQQQQQQQQQRPANTAPWRTVHQQPTSPPANPGERVIPIQIESDSPPRETQTPYQQNAQQQRRSQPQFNSGAGDWSPGPPIQSQSFRVLQKITDDVPQNQQPGRMNEMNAAQLRKLQLNDEDRALMDKFKAQVDGEVYLHQESDPRYRGAAIPSRAFRMLQNMTGEDDGNASLPIASRMSPAVRAAQQSLQESASNQPYVPPSEQTVQEPRKYTGGAIPSRSFRMLQAMTAGSENCDPADTSDL